MENKEMDYKISIDSVNEGIAVFRYTDGEAHLEYANKALIDLLQVSLEQIRGLDYTGMMKFVHKDDVEKLYNMVEALQQTKVGEYTYRFHKKTTGEIKWLTAHGLYLNNEDGEFSFFAFSDISEQVEAIEREQRLTRCIQLITDNSDFKGNLQKMMECLMEQYQADRAYIFEFDWPNDIMSNTIEVTAENVSPEIDELQNLPVNIVSYWLPHFRNNEAVFIENLEDIKSDPFRKDEYDVLVVQSIVSLMVVPISKNGELYGYVGVDNPHMNMGDKLFLNSIAFILAQEYLNRTQQKKLRELSLSDPLTKINNRHAYNQRIENVVKNNSIGIGVVFTDVNGLKYVNDQYGHREGDCLIIRAVQILEKYFRKDDLYRISGDEFVVIAENIPEEKFLKRVAKMKMDVSTEYGAIFSVGEIWNKSAEDIDGLIKRAEEMMYDDKKQFYLRFPEKTRRKQ